MHNKSEGAKVGKSSCKVTGPWLRSRRREDISGRCSNKSGCEGAVHPAVGLKEMRQEGVCFLNKQKTCWRSLPGTQKRHHESGLTPSQKEYTDVSSEPRQLISYSSREYSPGLLARALVSIMESCVRLVLLLLLWILANNKYCLLQTALTKTPKPEWLINNRNPFLRVSEAGSLRSECRFWVGALAGADFLSSPLVTWQKENTLALCLFWKGTSSTHENSILRTWFPFKGPTSKYLHNGVLISTWILEGHKYSVHERYLLSPRHYAKYFT